MSKPSRSSGEYLNELIDYGVERYYDYLKAFFRYANESGFLMGDVPPRNKLEELQNLAAKVPKLIAALANPELHPATKARAGLELRRFYTLRSEFA